MATATKRAGRPARPAAAEQKRERFSLGLIVTAEMKQLIDETAKATGRTQSQVAELLMERAVQYDRTIAAMNRSLDEIRRDNIEAAFRAEGYTPEHSPYGKIWYPPGYPIGRSRFIPPEQNQ
jgi:hypothetical protein